VGGIRPKAGAAPAYVHSPKSEFRAFFYNAKASSAVASTTSSVFGRTTTTAKPSQLSIQHPTLPFTKGPDSVTPGEWAQAIADRRHLPFPDSVWPEVITSFEDLQKREKDQLDIVRELENKFNDLREQIRQAKSVPDGLGVLETNNNNIRKQMMAYMQQHEVSQL
jgi:hypothetical protein